MSGWVKLHRSFEDWEWIDDHQMVVFFIRCLLLANHDERQWRGKAILPGQFVSSIRHLSQKTGLTEKQIRTCILKMKKTGEMASQSTNEYTIFTLISWEKYQSAETDGKPLGKRRANEGQAEGKRRATNKNDKNEENEKEELGSELTLATQSKPGLEERVRLFGEALKPYAVTYPREMLLKFFHHWTEPTPSGTRARWELERTWELSRRLQTWASREKPQAAGGSRGAHNLEEVKAFLQQQGAE